MHNFKPTGLWSHCNLSPKKKMVIVPNMTDLKLIALDAEDLSVVSAHLQDALMHVSDLEFEPKSKRFACIVNRFNWLEASTHHGIMKPFERRRTGLRFERVLSARTMKIDAAKSNDVLSLLTLGFKETEPPGGLITLLYSGGAAIELNVECIEVELRDLGAAWSTRAKPVHRTSDKIRDKDPDNEI